MSKSTVRRMLCVSGATLLLVGMMALSVMAQNAPKSAKNPGSRATGARGTIVIFTNLLGTNYHAFNSTVGYFVDGANFFDQVLAQGFTPTSNVTFADAIMPMGSYTVNGGLEHGRPAVYLESDSGGLPSGTILDGPLTQIGQVADFFDGWGGSYVEFDCVACPSLTAGTQYWLVAQEPKATVELTWDEAYFHADNSSPFAFNQSGSITGGFLSVSSGVPRAAYMVEGQ